jgi:hypothetical protein
VNASTQTGIAIVFVLYALLVLWIARACADSVITVRERRTVSK